MRVDTNAGGNNIADTVVDPEQQVRQVVISIFISIDKNQFKRGCFSRPGKYALIFYTSDKCMGKGCFISFKPRVIPYFKWFHTGSLRVLSVYCIREIYKSS